jgi:hypothetical protein
MPLFSMAHFFACLFLAEKMKDSLSAKKNSARTGRSGQVLLDDKPTAHAKVQAFVQQLCSGKARPNCWFVLLTRPVAWRILSELGRAATMGISLVCYRSRRFRANERPRPADLGRRHSTKQGEGRYTEGKSVVLYLSRTVETAGRECPEDSTRPRVVIQEFRLSLPEVRAIHLGVDLESLAPYLHYTLLESEYLPEESPFVPVPYRATQFLAFLCRLLRVEGMEYPSVKARYRDNPQAVNFVILGAAVAAAGSMTAGEPFDYEGPSSAGMSAP